MVTRLPLEDAVLDTLRPMQEEKDHVCGIAQRVLERIRQSGQAEGMVVGSIARHTWVRGDRDLDIFMLFDPSLPREELEKQGLALARSIAAAFTDRYHEKYAEHPYINATIEDVDVDLVPCYNVESAARIQSAVDRTPFHTRYITEKINGLIDDVLLLKRFTKAGGIYGSDQMTEGFSGYLCELLILHYGGFTPLLRAAAEWKPQTIIDLENHVAKEFDEPLVMIDPVDPKRNVAAAVSVDRMAEFVELARGYLESPAESFFSLPEEPPITPGGLAALLEERGTSLYAITFPTPPYIEEIVVPQLEAQHGSGLRTPHAQRFLRPPRPLPDGARSLHDPRRAPRLGTPGDPQPPRPPGLEPDQCRKVPVQAPLLTASRPLYRGRPVRDGGAPRVPEGRRSAQVRRDAAGRPWETRPAVPCERLGRARGKGVLEPGVLVVHCRVLQTLFPLVRHEKARCILGEGLIPDTVNIFLKTLK